MESGEERCKGVVEGAMDIELWCEPARLHEGRVRHEDVVRVAACEDQGPRIKDHGSRIKDQ